MHSNLSLKIKNTVPFYPQYVLLKKFSTYLYGRNDEAVREINCLTSKSIKNKTDYTLDLKLTLVVAFFKTTIKKL
jgi:hypothetical protein